MTHRNIYGGTAHVHAMCTADIFIDLLKTHIKTSLVLLYNFVCLYVYTR